MKTLNMVFCFDGTDNDPTDVLEAGDTSMTNVLRMHLLFGGTMRVRDSINYHLANGGELSQVARDGIDHTTAYWVREAAKDDHLPGLAVGSVSAYFSGIGTIERGLKIPVVGRLVNRVSKTINKTLAPSWMDADYIVTRALSWMYELTKRYRSGGYDDYRVLVFGYSRGAALARKFSAKALKHGTVEKIDFLGVFDTVAAMDGIRKKGEEVRSDVLFEDDTIDARISKAVHAVALDEDRAPFAPTLLSLIHI